VTAISPFHRVPFRSQAGVVLAYVTITPEGSAKSLETAPLIEVSESDAREYGESPVQLREGERYEYEVESLDESDLRLRCSLASRRKSLRQDQRDAGRIETGTWCGTLLLELVQGNADNNKQSVASALLDVRSVKVDYRSEYRGMLRRIADEIAGLVADARSSAKTPFRSSFEERRDAGWLQIQLELLRETLTSTEFSAALRRILAFPHERLATEVASIRSDSPIRWTPSALRQLAAGNPRRDVPEGHPLRSQTGMRSIADRVRVARRERDLDTPENRFVKHVLREFLAFLSHAHSVFEASPGWAASAALCNRLAAAIEDWLARSFFQELGDMRFAPLGSPVLQRKAGYREILRWWLRFRTAAELSWEGGEDLFRAGQRDVGTLYEYWLFFELLDWFCDKCNEGSRPPIDELIDGLDESSPSLRLKKKSEFGPFAGKFSGNGRTLNAQFAYNRRFNVTHDRADGGSWTRRLHPDYTLTFWPDGLTRHDAERAELLVHVHFDAKYRVENIEALFGAEGEEDADDEHAGNYKRQDLLKMHAYRDAIKRSQGAYILYPGRGASPVKFTGFHEILPGLGAFAVAPDEHGKAEGFEALDKFLSEVLDHLANRTTAQERVSYHVAEAYSGKDRIVPHAGLSLPEMDQFGTGYRALPPAEHMVLLAWFQNEAQRTLAASEDGLVYVRLGRRKGGGGLHVHPNLARVRHILLRSHEHSVATGLLLLREPGFRVYTRLQLRQELLSHAKGKGVASWEASAKSDDEEMIYALFRTAPDNAFEQQRWNGEQLMKLIEVFESDVRNKLVVNLGRSSAYPRVIPFRDVLQTRLF
jgi:predicted component of viral defense system (DUF524 family)